MLERSVLGGGDLAHLPLLLPPSVHGCLLLFISHGGLLSFIHCCLLCHCWWHGPCFLCEQQRGEGDTHCSPGCCPSFMVMCGHCLIAMLLTVTWHLDSMLDRLVVGRVQTNMGQGGGLTMVLKYMTMNNKYHSLSIVLVLLFIHCCLPCHWWWHGPCFLYEKRRGSHIAHLGVCHLHCHSFAIVINHVLLVAMSPASRSYQFPPYSCRILVIPVEWKLAGRPANFLIPVFSHSSGIGLFQNLHWNGPWNGQEWNSTGILLESVHIFTIHYSLFISNE